MSLSAARAEGPRLAAMSKAEFVRMQEERKAPKEEAIEKPTFHEACEMYADAQIKMGVWPGRHAKAYKTFESRMRCHVWPVLGDKPVDEITPHGVADMTAACWKLTETKDRCLTLTKVVLDWCRAEGLADHDNPASLSGPLRFLLPRGRTITRNRGVLAVADLPKFFAASMKESQSSSRQCFEFSILTAPARKLRGRRGGTRLI